MVQPEGLLIIPHFVKYKPLFSMVVLSPDLSDLPRVLLQLLPFLQGSPWVLFSLFWIRLFPCELKYYQLEALWHDGGIIVRQDMRAPLLLHSLGLKNEHKVSHLSLYSYL